MVQFRADTSFPFLKIAREHGVSYGDVLRFSERVEAEAVGVVYAIARSMPRWQIATLVAISNEEIRRFKA